MFFADEAIKRKKRNIKILKDEGVPYIEHLPVIESANNITLQKQEDVCYRALSIGLIAALGEGLESEIFWEKIDEFNLRDKLSPEELEFANLDERDTRKRAKFTWRYECLWVLIWSIGFIDSLGRPNHICDVQHAVGILVAQPVEEFLTKAKLRDVSDILDKNDLIFRYHWAITEARLKGQTSVAGLNGEVIYEWHYAFNWLTNAFDEEWDEVSTNT